MGTPYATIIDKFLNFVEEDRDFFSYFRVDESTATELVYKRVINFMMEAVDKIVMECQPTVDYTMMKATVTADNEVEGSFAFDLNQRDTAVIVYVMYERYMHRHFAKLSKMNVNFTSTEFRVFDPSNERKTFKSIYDEVKAQADYMMDVYKNTSREDGSYNLVDFSLYDTTEETNGF